MSAPITTLTLHIALQSAATFGHGEGVPGLVDQEVEHDAYGQPYLRGRTLRGLLAEEMQGLLFALGTTQAQKWQAARIRLLGTAGQMAVENGIMHVGDACLPNNLRRLIAVSIGTGDSRITPARVLESLTAIRRQTAMTPFGAPEPASLRVMRVILRGTRFEAQLTFDEEPQRLDFALLAATVLAWRRAGTGRNRGRGRLQAWLQDEAWTRAQFDIFRQEVVPS